MPAQKRRAIITGDLGFGDAGKGSIVDYLTRQYHAHTIIRYNGGAQAAHNVVTHDGRHHTFAQFGSGMFSPNTKTYLSQFMMIDPLAMLNEGRYLQDVGVTDIFGRTSLNCHALIITPYQQAANRLKEMSRGASRHGSCGMGIGETMSDFLTYNEQVLFVGDLCNRQTTVRKLRFMRDLKYAEVGSIIEDHADARDAQMFYDADLIDTCADLYQHFARQVQVVDEHYLKRLLDEAGVIVFEGAQGVLLDENYGFHPYTTWSNITFENALTLLDGYQGEIIRLGITRAYTPRHGAGPLVTEDKNLSATIPDQHNTTNTWQQNFRIGHLDIVMTRYAINVMQQVDYLAVTNLDRLVGQPEWKICSRYHYRGTVPSTFFEHTGQTIHNICVPRPANLDHQARLTQYLNHCEPQYDIFRPAENTPIQPDFIKMIEAETGVQVALISHGTTAYDKTMPAPGL